MARTRGGRESAAPIRSAETGGDGGTPRNARTGAGGGSGRRGLPVLTLVLAAAVASAQPLVSPADEAALRRLLPEADHFELHGRGARHFRAFAAPASTPTRGASRAWWRWTPEAD